MNKLEELKKWCKLNSDEQDGMDNDSGVYEHMEYLKLEDIIKKIDELLEN